MTAIDTSTWDQFRVGDLFSVEKGTGFPVTSMEDVEGGTPLISAKATDNSVALRAPVPHRFEAGTITVVTDGAGMGFATVQVDDFDIASNAVALVRSDLSERSSLFVCAAFRRSVVGFNYANKLNASAVREFRLRLPATPSGDPDWDSMSQMMGEVLDQAQSRIETLREPVPASTPIDTSTWKEFKVLDLFEIKRGKGSTRDLGEGPTPLVTATSSNNGIAAFVDAEPDVPVGTITVSVNGAGCGFTAVQPTPVKVGTDAVALVRGEPLDETVALFVASALTNETQVFDWSRKLTMTEWAALALRLPATSSGEPDWDAMAGMMSGVLESAQGRLNGLKGL